MKFLLEAFPSDHHSNFRMVGVTGIEPVTSSLSGTRSNQLSYTPRENLEFRRQKAEVLYPPFHPSSFILHTSYLDLVEAAGVEPATSSLQSWRSTN